MKKIVFLFVLMSVLSVSVIADDGQIPIGGKSCLANQNCLIAPDRPDIKESPDVKIQNMLSAIWKFIVG